MSLMPEAGDRRRAGRWCLLALAVTLVGACGGDESPATGARSEDGAEIRGELTVFAASSLTDAFKAAAQRFEALHPGVSVAFNFGASSALVVQIDEGAPADILASADQAQMSAATAKGHVRDARVFATNVPVVVVPKSGSPVARFDDLAKRGVRLVLAGPDVPIGRYSREILAKAAAAAGGPGAGFAETVLANVRSNEANVRAVLTKVQLGEADAGIVYRTDVRTAGDDVRTVEVPPAYNVLAEYPIAVTSTTRNADAADAWIAFLLSAEGQEILAQYGFGKVAVTG
jgi:molybdate transport system substrate-binding protein